MKLHPTSLPTSQLAAPPAVIAPQGLLPARTYPDRRINMKKAGQLYWLQPEDYPIQVATTVTASTMLTTVNEGWDYYVMLSSGHAENTANGLPFSRYRVSVRMRSLQGNELMMDDDEFVPFAAMFGAGGSPRRWTMPWVLPANDTILIEVRNDTALTLDIFMKFGVQKRACE